MKNIRTKNLILSAIVVFSLFFIITNDVLAHYRNGRYDSSYWLDSTDLVDDNYNYYYDDLEYSYYTPTYYQQPTSYGYYTPTSQPDTYVVNNYYYQTPNTSTAGTNNNTNTASNNNTNTTTKNDNSLDNSKLESSSDSYNEEKSKSEITALAFKGSGSFMPSSIWQWMLVVVLILIIIVISRMFVKKPSPADHDSHGGHPAH